MSDEPKREEHLQESGLGSMFDRWNKEKIRLTDGDMKNNEQNFSVADNFDESEALDLKAIDRKLGKDYLACINEIRDREKVGTDFRGINGDLYIYVSGGGYDESGHDDPPDDWMPDHISIWDDVGGIPNSISERIKRKTFLGKVLPSYFRNESGKIFSVSNHYDFDEPTNRWFKTEILTSGLYEGNYGDPIPIDPLELPTVEKIETLLDQYSVKPAQEITIEASLDANDYEQLQTILTGIQTGELIKKQD